MEGAIKFNICKIFRKKHAIFLCFSLFFIFGSKLSFAQTEEYMSYEDFLFDVEAMLGSNIKVQVPIYSLNIPKRTIQVDFQNLSIDVSQIDRKILKDVNALCNGMTLHCYLDVDGMLDINPEMFPTYSISANDANLWVLIGVAVADSGLVTLGIDEQNAITNLLDVEVPESYISGYEWINTTGTFAVAYAVGISEYYVGWGFNPDQDLAIETAMANCKEQKARIVSFTAKCEASIFNIPWW